MLAWRTKKFLPLWARPSGNMIAPPKRARKRLLPPPLRRTRSHPANTNAYLSKSPQRKCPHKGPSLKDPRSIASMKDPPNSVSRRIARGWILSETNNLHSQKLCVELGGATLFAPCLAPFLVLEFHAQILCMRVVAHVHACIPPILEAPRTIFVHARSWIFGGPNHVKRPRQCCSQHRWT